jgi:hypothetical protein
MNLAFLPLSPTELVIGGGFQKWSTGFGISHLPFPIGLGAGISAPVSSCGTYVFLVDIGEAEFPASLLA